MSIREQFSGRIGPTGAVLAALCLLVGLSGCTVRAREEAACATPQTRPSASGFCVPRWLSLKSNEALARAGPGFDYPALWTYRSRGLPVQVVAETAEWRRVCDPDGGAVWVHRSMVDGRRMVLSPRGAPLTIHTRPSDTAPQAAMMAPRSLASLDHCENGWCRIEAGGVDGWIPQASVWGTAGPPQCR